MLACSALALKHASLSAENLRDLLAVFLPGYEWDRSQRSDHPQPLQSRPALLEY